MSRKPVIVVAEDDAQIARLVSYRLERMGMEVHVGEDGAIALGMVRELTPDVVVLDVMMPVMNGFEVLRSMKDDETTRDIPAILLTAREAARDMEKGRALGASVYMTKPFSPTELVENIVVLLDGKVH